MSWFYLFFAIVSEVIGTTFMKLSEGLTQVLPSATMLIFYAISLSSLSIAIKKIDVSIAYKIWSGLGTVLISVIGILWFKETANTLKIISIGLVISGVIGLKLSGGTH
jgi:small multidrug resistance pump